MRTFIAIGLTPEIKIKLKEIRDKLRRLPVKIKWVEPENLHITLKFLGNLPEKKLAEVKRLIAAAANRYHFFNLYLENFGFFPNQRKPRILFIKASSKQILENIAESLEEELEKAGFGRERKFKPHITLARIKKLKNINRLTEKIAGLEAKGKLQVKKISLFKSTLTPKGPVYEEIFKSSLKD